MYIFQASIGQSFAQSQGIALGKNQPLRIRLECRNPHLILLPWEIMQQAGKQAISLHPNILFSRTTSRQLTRASPAGAARGDRSSVSKHRRLWA